MARFIRSMRAGAEICSMISVAARASSSRSAGGMKSGVSAMRKGILQPSVASSRPR